MSSSLRDIPGARTGGRRSRKDSLAPRKRDGGMLRPAQPQALMGGRRRKRAFGRRVEVDRVNLAIALAFVALAVFGGFWLWNQNQVDISATGVDDGAVVTPQEVVGLEITVDVSPTTRLDSAEFTFDGEDPADAGEFETTDTGFVFRALPGEGLPTGEHRLAVRVPRAVAGTATWDLSFEVRP